MRIPPAADIEPILTLDEIDIKRNKEVTLSKTDCSLVANKIRDHHDKYDFFNSVFPKCAGQHFLYENFIYSHDDANHLKVSYPKLGIYLNAYPCDQTIEVEWVDHRRTWEWNSRFSEHCFVAEQTSELKYLPLWSDSMMIYGVWDKMPDWRQLKQAYERTWWFWRSPEELRDMQINRLLR